MHLKDILNQRKNNYILTTILFNAENVFNCIVACDDCVFVGVFCIKICTIRRIYAPRLRGNRNDLIAFYLSNLLVVNQGNHWLPWPQTTDHKKFK